MKAIKNLSIIIVLAVAAFWTDTALAQDQPSKLNGIVIYKGDVAGPGTGINGFKLAVGEEMTLTAKGIDESGKDVPIWPTWKADSELSIKVVEGRSKTVVVKALKVGSPLFVTAIYITDDGKKVTSDAMGSVIVK